MNALDDVFVFSLGGGLLIGLAVTLMLLLLGRVTGISGIVGGALSLWLRPEDHSDSHPKDGGHRQERANHHHHRARLHDTLWRLAFVVGLVAGGFALATFQPSAIYAQPERPNFVLIIAGLLVGFGTLMGSGCTSGHAVCGLSRLSPRSFISTLLFMAMGILTVYIVRNGFQ